MNETNNNNNFSQNIWMEIFFHQIFIITNPCITNTVISNKKLNSCRRRCFFKQIFAKDYLFGAIYTVFTKKLWRWSSIQNAFLSSRLKKYGSGLSWRWALLTAWAFGFFLRTRFNIEHYSQLKPTKVGFIFTGPNSLSRA